MHVVTVFCINNKHEGERRGGERDWQNELRVLKEGSYFILLFFSTIAQIWGESTIDYVGRYLVKSGANVCGYAWFLLRFIL